MGNLWERAAIPFEEPLREGEVQQLFDYLANQIPGAVINYSIEKKGRISHREHDVSMDEYPVRMNASIHSPEIPLMSCFEVSREPVKEAHQSHRGDLGLFFGIRFDLAGYDYEEEVPDHDLQMIDIVREKTQEFFQSHEESKE